MFVCLFVCVCVCVCVCELQVVFHVCRFKFIVYTVCVLVYILYIGGSSIHVSTMHHLSVCWSL